MLEDILSQVHKPGRYIGREWNQPEKDFDRCEIKFALCFPDLYEIGMSNLGLRIIYGLLNSFDHLVCERFFSPAQDMEGILRSKAKEIFSLESQRRLRDFDFVGFSLGYELCYTNVLNILELGNIPLRQESRGRDYPLVIGGGPAVLNPEPLADFFDLFVIGEAEEAILEIIALYRKLKSQFKSSRLTKEDLLLAFSGIEGVYAPSLYEVAYDAQGKIEKFQPRIKGPPEKIKKRFVKDLNSSYFPLDWLLPYIQIVHDRVTLEIMRGCPNACRFCQARTQYFPFRKRNLGHLLNLAAQVYQRSGYEELSLCGLSVSDYPQLAELYGGMMEIFKNQAVSVSLPSIKPKKMVGGLSALIAAAKKTGLTFAPEVASEKLSRLIGKDFDFADFFSVLDEAYAAGYQHVKLYFMIGLPTEEEADLDAIADLCLRVSELRRKINKGPAQVNISVNTLIPKPHTAFQWFAMEDLPGIKGKQDYLKKKMARNKRLIFSFHRCQMSFLEAVFSRGDRRLGEVILRAFQKGARFDAWDNYFIFEKWQDAFRESGIDPAFYLKEKARDEILPWDFLDIGISREALWLEFNKAIAK